MISLAGRDILHSWGKFVFTGVGLGLLIGVTLTMAGVYRGMVDAGVPHTEALERTKQQAQRVAETGAAAVAGLGGAATNKLIRGAEDFVGGMASRAARAGGTAALSGLEEGAQEVAEGMIGRAGAGLGAGVDRKLAASMMSCPLPCPWMAPTRRPRPPACPARPKCSACQPPKLARSLALAPLSAASSLRNPPAAPHMALIPPRCAT